VSERLDTFGCAEWQQTIDALGVTAEVRQASDPGGERYTLTKRLEGILTVELIRKLSSQIGGLEANRSWWRLSGQVAALIHR
jgi:hypothetical protein